MDQSNPQEKKNGIDVLHNTPWHDLAREVFSETFRNLKRLVSVDIAAVSPFSFAQNG
jgi:hypothetical protein